MSQGLESDSELKAKEQERLRAAEKFMIIGSGTATCGGCGYEYKPDRGDPDFPVPRGTTFKVRFIPHATGKRCQHGLTQH